MRAIPVVLVTFIAFSLFTLQLNRSEAHSARARIPIAGHGAIEFPLPEGWTYGIRQPGAMPPTIQFEPEKGRKFKTLVSVLWSPKGDPSFNSLDNILAAIESARARAAMSAVEDEIPIQVIKGEHIVGRYFVATDRAPKPGEYRYMTHGIAALDDLMLTFTILSNDRKGGISSAGLRMLEGTTKGVE